MCIDSGKTIQEKFSGSFQPLLFILRQRESKILFISPRGPEGSEYLDETTRHLLSFLRKGKYQILQFPTWKINSLTYHSVSQFNERCLPFHQANSKRDIESFFFLNCGYSFYLCYSFLFQLMEFLRNHVVAKESLTSSSKFCFIVNSWLINEV